MQHLISINNSVRLITLVSLAALATAGCGDDPEFDLAGRASAIVNGVDDNGHPTVGRIAGGAEGHCTATLIGPKTVLTAGHCLTKKGPGYIVFPVSVSFSGGLSTHDAASAVVHPNYGKYYYSADIGIVRLKEVVTGINPTPLSSAVPKIGDKALLVGFGITATGAWGTSGVKRMAGNTISAMSNDNITFTGSNGTSGNLCSGDSGGPTFVKQGGQDVIIGVHSTGSVPCGHSGNDIRVDLYRAWIIKEAKGDVGNTKDAQSPSVIISSPGEYEAVSTNFSVAIQATDNVGVDRVVVKLDGAQVGQGTKAPFSFPLKDVKPGSRRISATAYDKAGNTASDSVDVIVSKSATKAAMGAACTNDSDCVSGLCVAAPGGTGRICSDTCDPANDSCPKGYSCGKAGGRNVCLPPVSQPDDPADRGGCAYGGAASGAGGATLVWALLLGLMLRRRGRAATSS